MEETLIRVAQFILSLSILVTLHEFGHYITARMFKTRVEKFYLFFDFLFPFPGIANFALFKKKIGETEYGLGWFPMGGYVKISGMIDESMDEEAMKLPPQPWEFRSKPAWQRLIIMLGGIIVNIILAIFIYSMILLAYGEKKLPIAEAKYGYVADSLAQSIGLQSGDKIVGYNNTVKFDDASISVVKDMLFDDATSIQITRNGEAKSITVPPNVWPDMIKSRGKVEFLRLAFPSEIDSVDPKSQLRGKLQHNDKIIGIDDEPIQYFAEISMAIKRKIGKDVTVTALRGVDTLKYTAHIGEDALLGISGKSLDNYFNFDSTKYNIITCFPAGLKLSVSVLGDYIRQFKLMFNTRFEGWKQMGGFASISKLYSTKWDWLGFWMSTAFLSIVLAFMNLLPIPALDGGHALFTLYEIITRRKPSDKFLEYAQIVGMIFVFGLLIFANGNDLFRYIMSKLGG